MSTGSDLLEHEKQAGNESDNFNPGEKNYNSTFNDIVGENLEDVDAHGDKIIKNYNSDNPKKRNFNSDSEQTKNIDDTRDKESSGGGGLYKAGGIAAGSKLSGGIMGKMKNSKSGPTKGVAGLLILIIFGTAGTGIGLGSSLLINIKEMFHNDRSDGTRTNRLFSRGFLANKLNNKDGCTGSKIKCKLSTLSKKEMQSYKDAGFDIKGKEVDSDGKKTNKDVDTEKSSSSLDDSSRIEVEEIKLPSDDGGKTRKVAKDGKTFYNAIDSSPSLLRSSERAFASKASFYLNKFFSSVLKNKWKFTKGKKNFPTEDEKNKDSKSTKSAQDEAFDEQSDGVSESDDDKLDKKATEASNNAEDSSGVKKSKKGSVITTITQTLCQAYKLARGGVTAVKIYQIYQLGKFALMFFQAADEIKGGRSDGNKVTYLSNNLTYYNPDKSSDEYGLTATDSDGYKIATYGKSSNLADFAKKYILGGSGTVKTLDTVLNKLDSGADKIPFLSGSGRQKIKTLCRAVSGGIAQLVTSCAGVTAALETFGSAAPVLGNIIGGVISVGTCACALYGELDQGIVKTLASYTPVGQGCDKIQEGVSAVKSKVLDWIKDGPLKEFLANILKEVSVSSDTKGVDAGNAIAAGAGLMLSTTATGYGLKPSSSSSKHSDISKYISYTQPLEDTYIALEKDDARQDPLDMTNRYSLLGSLVRSLDLSSSTTKSDSLLGNLATFTSLIPNAFSTLVSGRKASAAYNQPSTAADVSTGRFDECQDEDLESIGATGDTYCSIVAVSPTKELDTASAQAYQPGSTAFNDLADWMSKEQKVTIDSGDCTTTSGEDADCKDDNSEQASIDPDSGKPNSNSQYEKYLTYCTSSRKYPFGSQEEPYEQGTDRDQRWYSGEECMKGGDDDNSEEGQMVSKFRMWTNVCLQSGTSDGTTDCYSDDSSDDSEPVGSIAEVAKQMGAWGGQYKACYTYGGGHGKSAEWMKQAIAHHFTGEYAVDCSAFVRAVILQATGDDIGDNTTNTLCASSKFEHIPKADAKPGDLAISCSTHVEVITGVSGGQFSTVGSHSDGCGPGLGASPGNYQGTESFVLRYKK